MGIRNSGTVVLDQQPSCGSCSVVSAAVEGREWKRLTIEWRHTGTAALRRGWQSSCSAPSAQGGLVVGGRFLGAVCYATRFSVTTGRCLRPWKQSTMSSRRTPGLPRTFACGAAQGEWLGQRGRGSNRGRPVATPTSVSSSWHPQAVAPKGPGLGVAVPPAGSVAMVGGVRGKDNTIGGDR